MYPTYRRCEPVDLGIFCSSRGGIVRMLDLALSRDQADPAHGMYLVAPDGREADVRAQVQRPAFSRVGDLQVRYLPYSELEHNREVAMRFGRGLHPLIEMSRALT